MDEANNAGFSLLEVVVVLAIMGLILSIVGQRAVQNIESAYFVNTSESVLADVTFWKIDANVNQQPRIIEMTVSAPQNWTEQEKLNIRTLDLPEGWISEGEPIRISSTGMCFGGQVTLEDQNGRRIAYELTPPHCERRRIVS